MSKYKTRAKVAEELLNELEPKPAKITSKKVIVETETFKSFECAICLESLFVCEELVALICGHVFCKSCITRTIKEKHKCPKCLQRNTLKSLRRIYL